jgi:aquaporin Z
LTVINLVAIPVTNCSANPARSLGVAWFAGGGALSQMWLFIVAPTVGAAIAAYALITGAPSTDIGVGPNPELEESQRTA